MMTTYIALTALFSPVPAPYVGFHTYVAPQAVQEQKQPVLETFLATVTAYSSVETCGEVCITASGRKAYVGAVACPRRFPLGTKVNIAGYGVVVCEDRTALKHDGRFDIFLGYGAESHAEALRFGKQYKQVTILQ